MTSKASLFLFSLVLLCASLVQSQTTVVLAPIPIFSSYTQYGVPNAFGCVFTYTSGTTTPLATWTDFTGNTMNANPVVLSAGGTANIWLQIGALYSFQIKTSGGINCSSGSTLATVNGIGGGATTQSTAVPYSPTPAFPVTSQNQLFTLTLTGNAVALPISVTGVSAPSYITFQIMQDSVGGRTFTWPSNIVGGAPIGSAAGQVTTQMFVWNGSTAVAIAPATVGNGNVSALGQYLSPLLLTPFVNGCQMWNGPATYSCLPNAATTGTALLYLATLTGSPATAVLPAIGATGGVIGICVAQCGTAGTAVIQEDGLAQCYFDGGGTATPGDYVQISPTLGGWCHDAGAAYPAGQVIGRVISGGGNPYEVNLFGPEIQGRGAICASGAPVTVNANTTALQVVNTCAIAAGSLNATGKSFRATIGLQVEPSSTTWVTDLGMGASASLGTYANFVANATSGSAAAGVQGVMTCVVTTAGSSGALTCSLVADTTSSTATVYTPNPGFATFSGINLTGTVYVGVACSFASASTSNSCVGNPFVVEQLN